ncbi:MAG: hypothetical protein K0R06_114 [Clostridium sp.]|jgi:uncharacterized membrane-anchored protein YitT (DUF2179 family)|nr:hypothetical protein [Clostridium sp.]
MLYYEGGNYMKKITSEYCFLIVGSILFSISTSFILLPAHIGLGGITGIAISLNKLFGYKIGLANIIMNVPLFIIGFNILGKKFVFKSVLVVITSSVMIDYLNVNFILPKINDMILSAIFYGVLAGISMALIFMSGGSSGGVDILAKIINHNSNSINVSTLLLISDIIVYILVAIVMGPRSVMYAIIVSYVRSKTMDAMQEGLSSSRQCIIICEKYEDIIDNITLKLVRGATVINAVGAYTNKDKKIIYIVIQKTQLRVLKRIVKGIEPGAFIAISQVNDVHGNYRNIMPRI